MRRWSSMSASSALCGVMLVALAACNAINGTADLVEVGDEGAGQKPDTTYDDGGYDAGYVAPRDSGSTTLDGGGAPDVQDAAPPFDAPPICDQLTLMLRLDGTMTSSEGQAPTANPGGAFSAGKYGQAVALTGSSAVADYAASSGGKAIALAQTGTISGWVAARNWQMPCPNYAQSATERFFWGFDTNGLFVDCEQNPNDGQSYISTWVPINQSSSYGANVLPPWNGGGAFNHVVATWSQSPPSLTITVNGKSAAFTQAWNPPSATLNVFELGAPEDPGSMIYDDVAVWTRPLSAAEIASIYTAGKSMADVCGLP